jgi:hypothetical protein
MVDQQCVIYVIYLVWFREGSNRWIGSCSCPGCPKAESRNSETWPNRGSYADVTFTTPHIGVKSRLTYRAR